MGTMYPKGPFPSFLNLAGSITRYPVGNGQSTSSIAPLPLDAVTRNKSLVLLPEETDLVAFSPSLLRVNSQDRQLLPVTLVL